MLVDTHVHVISADHDRYPLRPSTRVGPWYLDAPCPIEELRTLMAEAAVDRAVIVQPFTAYGFDNRYTIDSARAHAECCTSVGCVEPQGDDPAGTLRGLVERDGMRGLRWVALDDAPLADPASLWAAADSLGVPVVVTVLRDRLPELARVVPALPAVPIALDHCGFVDFSHGIPAPLRALAPFPNVHLKVSTIVLEQAAAHGDVRDLVAELAACFGASRLMWGSDWSQTHHVPYSELVEIGRQAAARLADADRDAFLGDTALTLWPELA